MKKFAIILIVSAMFVIVLSVSANSQPIQQPIYLDPPTPAASAVNIPLPGGEYQTVFYRWTFGEMAIISLLIIQIFIWIGYITFDIVMRVWSQRRNVVIEDRE